MSYSASNINMSVHPGDENEDIASLKLALSVVIFTLPQQQRDGILRTLSEISDPAVERLYRQIMQVHPSNN
ncbi:hypothetical protein [Serratia entomophila]|uniref:hypothetical protein n=1 Tax=Serratia entomophila TaxID=42906 RepID=UPI0021B7C8D7|nr:hypothetical protein [Serratia entomophila]